MNTEQKIITTIYEVFNDKNPTSLNHSFKAVFQLIKDTDNENLKNGFERALSMGFDINYWCNELSEMLKGKRVNNCIEPFIKITLAYLDNTRYYHSIVRIQNLLKKLSYHLDEIVSETGINKDCVNAIKFVLLFHDMVYKVGNSENEYYSSILARSMLFELGFDKEFVYFVEQGILSTWYSNSDKKPITLIDKIAVDLDLCGFGSTWKEYSLNTKNVLKEMYPEIISDIYCFNDITVKDVLSCLDKQALIKRSYFLSSLLTSTELSLFNTNVFIENYKHIALANISKELDIITVIIKDKYYTETLNQHLVDRLNQEVMFNTSEKLCVEEVNSNHSVVEDGALFHHQV